jgi:hypothetical protein
VARGELLPATEIADAAGKLPTKLAVGGWDVPLEASVVDELAAEAGTTALATLGKTTEAHAT